MGEVRGEKDEVGVDGGDSGRGDEGKGGGGGRSGSMWAIFFTFLGLQGSDDGGDIDWGNISSKLVI